jgi:Flp pilus assembly pilin Flp
MITREDRVTSLRRAFDRLIREEEGLQTVEWAVLGSAIAIVCLIFYASLGGRVTELIDELRAVF